MTGRPLGFLSTEGTERHGKEPITAGQAPTMCVAHLRFIVKHS